MTTPLAAPPSLAPLGPILASKLALAMGYSVVDQLLIVLLNWRLSAGAGTLRPDAVPRSVIAANRRMRALETMVGSEVRDVFGETVGRLSAAEDC